MLVKALITFPKDKRPKLMLMPSLRVDPVAPVFFNLSEPARSTKWNFEQIEPLFSYWSVIRSWRTVIVKIAWDLEELSFISVWAVERWMEPFSRMPISSKLEETDYYVRPRMLMLPPSSIIEGGSLFLRFLESDTRRSKICSL